MKFFFIIIFFFLINVSLYANNIGSQTGYKLPRYVSLKSDETNMRVGSSLNYPIILKYTIKNMPIEIIDEYGLWRKTKDFKENIGWIHKNLIKGERYGIINPDKIQYSKIYSKPLGHEIGKIGELNVVKINVCLVEWCKIQHLQNIGWIKKKNIWGIYSYEIIDRPFYQPLINLIWQIL